jgi:sphingolipid C9-methyltransferase
MLIACICSVPLWLSYKLGGGIYLALVFGLFTSIPILVTFWLVTSAMAPRKNEKAKYPGRPIEYYLTFKTELDKAKYYGSHRIPMWTFFEKYFDGEVDFNGDALEVMEYRHDWASFGFTIGLARHFLFGLIPEAILHTRSQGEFLCAASFEFMEAYCAQTRSKSAITTTAATTFTHGSWDRA